MTYITKPALHHPSLTQNKVGYSNSNNLIRWRFLYDIVLAYFAHL